jgi:alpha-tubulin suppressor-like RCC1 family protein
MERDMSPCRHTGCLVALFAAAGGCGGDDVAFDAGAEMEAGLDGELPDAPSDAGGMIDAGPAMDAGPMDAAAGDAGAEDAGEDAGATDAGVMDGGAMDGGPPDAGTTDGGAMDGGAMDAGFPDAGLADAGPGDGGMPLVAGLSAGARHTCAWLDDGTAHCWGNNAQGQLGDGTTDGAAMPVAVVDIAAVTAIAAGDLHTCALVSGGAAYCWGTNLVGQLGVGASTPASSSMPLAVMGITGASSIVAGAQHTCVLLAGGTARCWGQNQQGRLGDGTTTSPRRAPVAVMGLSGATALAAGGAHTCAVLTDGTATCWGLGSHGERGDGTTTTSRSVAGTPVSGLADVTAITAGGSHSCALLGDGTVWCWGWNGSGQVGDGGSMTAARPLPVAVPGLSNAVAVEAGESHSCAVLDGGSARCWGANGRGQLGDGTMMQRPTPNTFMISGVASLAAGGTFAVSAPPAHTCALLTDGTAHCTGNNDDGQLGDGTMMPRTTPVAVSW